MRRLSPSHPPRHHGRSVFVGVVVNFVDFFEVGDVKIGCVEAAVEEEAESRLVACFLLISSLSGRSSIALEKMSLPVGGSMRAIPKRLEAER
eukprot:COSAG01_NODE_19_length_39011_cov_38.134968_27_plen_92_part_00